MNTSILSPNDCCSLTNKLISSFVLALDYCSRTSAVKIALAVIELDPSALISISDFCRPVTLPVGVNLAITTWFLLASVVGLNSTSQPSTVIEVTVNGSTPIKTNFCWTASPGFKLPSAIALGEMASGLSTCPVKKA